VTDKPKKLVYLAGPEVFLPDAREIGRRKKALCERYDFKGLFPFDNEVGRGPGSDRDIYRSNIQMMEQAHCGILNLTPFRGASADVGTVFELGFLSGLRKPTFGYTNEDRDFMARTRDSHDGVRDQQTGDWRDKFDMTIEDYGNADNLMIDGRFAEQQRAIVRIVTTEAQRFRDLRGFELCLEAARSYFDVLERTGATAASSGCIGTTRVT
jgi:nucleoside 2-deoxyribosyltransferase